MLALLPWLFQSAVVPDASALEPTWERFKPALPKPTRDDLDGDGVRDATDRCATDFGRFDGCPLPRCDDLRSAVDRGTPFQLLLDWNGGGVSKGTVEAMAAFCAYGAREKLERVRHGAFTYFAVGALRGWADGELSGQRDGQVTGAEAAAYVERALRSAGVRDQRPNWIADGATGEDWVLTSGAPERGPGL